MAAAWKAPARRGRSWSWAAALLLAGACVVCSSTARGDGDTLRYTKRRQDLEVSVFTGPDPVYMGTADVSLLLQPLPPDSVHPLPAYQICAYPVGKPEQKHCEPPAVASVVNKVFRAARLEFTEPGPWQIEILIDSDHGVWMGQFELPVENGYSPRETYGRWIGLPAVAVLVYVVHRRLSNRRRLTTRSTRPPGAGNDVSQK
jgi:hypothetical protein